MEKIKEIGDLMRCANCGRSGLDSYEGGLRCGDCGNEDREWKRGVLVSPRLKNSDGGDGSELSFYEIDTKRRYQSDDYAKHYHERYEKPRRLRNFYDWFIAQRERKVSRRLIAKVANDVGVLLDLPAGTGKLTAVHSEFNYEIVAADVSAEMLRTGKDAWGECGDKVRGLVQMDVMSTELRDDAVDCVVCLRLMHRLSKELVRKALKELSRCSSKYVIVSNGINELSLAGLANKVIRRKEKKRACSRDEWNELLNEIGTVEAETYVARGLSKEIITLVKLRREE